MSRTFTRLPLAEGIWMTNFIAIPPEFARAIRSSYDTNIGVVPFRLNWTGTKENGELETKECFVGWSGALSRGSYLQVPQKLSEFVGLSKALEESKTRGGVGLSVNIYAIKDCPIAKRVDVEPETFEDWETLERHAGFVENQMLSQICVLYPNQRFCVWVANVPVKLRVKAGVETNCVKIANETEVVVEPKPRPTIRRTIEKSNNKSEGKGKPVSLRVQTISSSLNGVALIHPSTLELMKSVADWDVFTGATISSDNNHVRPSENPTGLVFCRLMEDGPIVSLKISNDICFGHIGLSQSSRRLNIRPFTKISVIPISDDRIVSPPPSFSLRKIIYSNRITIPSTSFLSAGELASSLSHQSSVLCDGNWIEVNGCMYKIVVTNGSYKGQYWVYDEDEKDNHFTMGEELQLEIGEDEEIYNNMDEDGWNIETIGGPGYQVGKQLKQYFSPLLSIKGSLSRVQLGTIPSGGCYLYGTRGSGKSTLLRALRKSLGEDEEFLTNVCILDCANLKGGKRSMVQKKFESIVQQGQTRCPSLIVFEDLDALLPNPSNPGEEDAQTIWLSEFLEGLIIEQRLKFNRFEEMAKVAIEEGKMTYQDIPNWNRNAIGFIATGRGKKSLRNALLRVGLFENKIEMPMLDAQGRNSVLKALAIKKNIFQNEQEIEEVATKTEGYSAGDLDTLVDRAIHSKALEDVENNTQQQHQYLIQALDGFTPSSLKGVKLAKSDTAWSDVGGLDEVRMVLKETLELPFQFAELYDRSPQRLASGILLYGPPGCGKTLLAGAVASECGLNFISVKGPEVLNKYIGASEQAIRDLFARAASVTPCIIFFDEFDAIAPKRGNDSTGVTDRVVNQMLTFLDGVESRKGVYVMAATSRPDLVDPALLRPGRLDKQLFCGFPTESERLSILLAIGRKLKLSSEAELELANIAKLGTDLTGADLQALLATAQLIAIHEESPVISKANLLSAFADTRASVSKEDRYRLEKLYRVFRGDRDAPKVPENGMFIEDGKQKVALM